jgi:uncharacterized membrane protein
MSTVSQIVHHLHEDELKLLQTLRIKRRESVDRLVDNYSLGDKVADWVAAGMGSWKFIIGQSILLVIWIVLNVTAYVQQWDPYPFILLNLALSFQAAYAAPFIMMSQNRQAAIDRVAMQLLHQKIDLLRETEVSELVQVIRRLEARLPPSERHALDDLPPETA